MWAGFGRLPGYPFATVRRVTDPTRWVALEAERAPPATRYETANGHSEARDYNGEDDELPAYGGGMRASKLLHGGIAFKAGEAAQDIDTLSKNSPLEINRH